MASSIQTTADTITAVSSAASTASRLGAAIAGINSVSGIGSAIRSINLPLGGESILDVVFATANFAGDANENDWRVRLSLPRWPSFRNSPVLKPLVDAGGLIFPYTPTISISTSTTYESPNITHSNYKFSSYTNSDPGTISIMSAPMPVEDESQALYWIAALHYLRSVSKMFCGNDPKAGNPPPVVLLNGYGSYVFKNIPVVVSQFSVQLNEKCDYISCNVVGSDAGNIEELSTSVNQIGGAIGRIIPGVNKITNVVNSIASIGGQVSGVLRNFNNKPISGGLAYVPTNSAFMVTLIPMYSRTSVKNFSLDRFVSGGYLQGGLNGIGYI